MTIFVIMIVDISPFYTGHGPFSHLFDGDFIPKARPGVVWKVIVYMYVLCYINSYMYLSLLLC